MQTTARGTLSQRHSLYQDVQRVLARIPIDFGGGCSVSKAHLMAWLIRQFDLQTTLDIGVYRGRSLFPQAIAHSRHTGGVVYGVDPWCSEAAREFDHARLREAIARFADTTDFEAIYREVDALRHELAVTRHCALVRATSEEASVQFRSRGTTFGLIHIDGNHDTRLVMRDVELYRPLLQPNGFVVLDDISWDSVRPAYQALGSTLSLVFRRVGAGNDYAVFWDNRSRRSAAGLRLALQWQGRR